MLWRSDPGAINISGPSLSKHETACYSRLGVPGVGASSHIIFNDEKWNPTLPRSSSHLDEQAIPSRRRITNRQMAEHRMRGAQQSMASVEHYRDAM